MTRSRGRSKEDGEKSRPAGKQRSAGRAPRSVRTESQAERSFNPAERAEAHRRRVRSGAERQRGGTARGRGKDSLATQRNLPFEGLQETLLAHLRPEVFTQKLVRVGAGILLLLLAGALLLIAYNLSHGLRIFALGEVIIQRPVAVRADASDGETRTEPERQLITDREIEEEVRKMVPVGVLRVDLQLIRARLKQIEYIREAEVRRLLPDTLSLRITERVPVVLGRLKNGELKCIDEDGTLFGSSLIFSKDLDRPFIGNVQEEGANAAEINRAYLAAYRNLMVDIDRMKPQLSTLIDEVRFERKEEETQGIENNEKKYEVRVNISNSPTWVYLGREDYRHRLNIALDIIDAVRTQNLNTLTLFRLKDIDQLLSRPRIKYINPIDANRIMIGLDDELSDSLKR